MKGCCILSKAFSASNEGGFFVYMVKYTDRFSYPEPSLHLWDEAYLVMVEDFSDIFLDSVCQYFTECFCINVHE